MSWPQLHESGAAHHGAVALRCVRACGLDSRTFLRWVRQQELTQLQPNVFLLPGWPAGGAARTFAAALAAGSGAVVTGWSALAYLGLVRSWPTTTELVVPRGDHRQRLARVRTRWTSSLPSDAVIDVAGVRFTDTARSLAHLADRTSLHQLRALALDASSRGLLTPDHLERELRARHRFPGRTTIRQLLQDLQGDGSDSGFEFDTRERLHAVGLGPDAEQPTVVTRGGHRRIDIAFSAELVGIDCLGFSYHSAPEDLQADVLRSNELAELDRWLILQLTFRMFHQAWEPFLAQLRRCLAHRSAS